MRNEIKNLGMTLLLVSGWLLGCIETDDSKHPEDAVKIGALLPFTGDLAATGSNVERALIWVTEQVNENGGVAGRPIDLMTRDTNSTVSQGMVAARELIEDEKVVAIVGPEFADLALEMMPLIEENDVVQISGGVSSTAFTEIDEKGLWFRTCPSTRTLGSVLAQKIFNDGVRNPVIFHVADEYGTNFADMIKLELKALLEEAPFQLGFAPDGQSFRTQLVQVVERRPDAIVLIAYPKTGAAIVSDWNAMGGTERLYFSDALNNEVFIQNVPPDSIEGMVGVAHADTVDAEVFANQFAERWPGHYPLLSSYYNFDAMAVLALAIEEASVESGRDGIPAASDIADHIIKVSSSSTGKKVAWYEIDDGLELLRNKDVPAYAGINYRGASGFVELDKYGEVFSGLAQLWTVENGQIVKGERLSATPASQEGEE